MAIAIHPPSLVRLVDESDAVSSRRHGRNRIGPRGCGQNQRIYAGARNVQVRAFSAILSRSTY